MLLRSSPTPVVGTLDNTNNKHPPFHDHQSTAKISFFQAHRQHTNLTSFSFNSSSISHSSSGFSEFNREVTTAHSLRISRRALSDGNLEGLASTSLDIDEFQKPTKCLYKHRKSMLQTTPSFSIYNSTDDFRFDDEEEEGRQRKEMVEDDESLERSITIGENIGAVGSGDFSFGKNSMGLIIEEVGEEEALGGFQSLGFEEDGQPLSPPMYLATGLGIDSVGFDGSGGIDFTPPSLDESGGDVEEYYKRMVDEYPCHPLFLRNYAQLLQSKGELHEAEDYYYRATLADPGDGEILLQYAKLVWELHRDQDRALAYFERAAEVAPEDSHVLAAYAGFLWQIEDGEEEDTTQKSHIQIEVEKSADELHKSAYEEENEPRSPSMHLAAGLGIDAAGFGSGIGSNEFSAANFGEGGNIEEYYKKMVEENPCKPLILRNYAQFLYKTKGDLNGAEEYYSHAILADPIDGEAMSQYAQLVWELHRDLEKASSYHERAIQAAPEDCHILAAYASFLWETGVDEEDSSDRVDHIQRTVFQGVMTSANA